MEQHSANWATWPGWNACQLWEDGFRNALLSTCGTTAPFCSPNKFLMLHLCLRYFRDSSCWGHVDCGRIAWTYWVNSWAQQRRAQWHNSYVCRASRKSGANCHIFANPCIEQSSDSLARSLGHCWIKIWPVYFPSLAVCFPFTPPASGPTELTSAWILPLPDDVIILLKESSVCPVTVRSAASSGKPSPTSSGKILFPVL